MLPGAVVVVMVLMLAGRFGDVGLADLLGVEAGGGKLLLWAVPDRVGVEVVAVEIVGLQAGARAVDMTSSLGWATTVIAAGGHSWQPKGLRQLIYPLNPLSTRPKRRLPR